VAEWTVTEWTVTEWTESRNWTESTEAHEAKRSASRNWTASTEVQKRRASAQRGRQGEMGCGNSNLAMSPGGLAANL
jgi:hypothetical protein